MASVGALSNGSNALSGASSSAFSAMTSGDFTKLVLTELSKQDPLQPNDTKALLDQLSTIRSIQSNTDLSDKLTSLVSANEFASASGLIGKTVSGVSLQNARVSGQVASISKTDAGPVVNLKDGVKMLFKQVDQVSATQGA
jgi:flagellar basal-body rod modification protein FlgD